MSKEDAKELAEMEAIIRTLRGEICEYEKLMVARDNTISVKSRQIEAMEKTLAEVSNELEDNRRDADVHSQY